jgi:hypothetical protein
VNSDIRNNLTAKGINLTDAFSTRASKRLIMRTREPENLHLFSEINVNFLVVLACVVRHYWV